MRVRGIGVGHALDLQPLVPWTACLWSLQVFRVHHRRCRRYHHRRHHLLRHLLLHPLTPAPLTQSFQETFGLNEEAEALPSFKTINYQGDTVDARSMIFSADVVAALRAHLPLRVRFAPVRARGRGWVGVSGWVWAGVGGCGHGVLQRSGPTSLDISLALVASLPPSLQVWELLSLLSPFSLLSLLSSLPPCRCGSFSTQRPYTA